MILRICKNLRAFACARMCNFLDSCITQIKFYLHELQLRALLKFEKKQKKKGKLYTYLKSNSSLCLKPLSMNIYHLNKHDD
jgi:hypothetical protein